MRTLTLGLALLFTSVNLYAMDLHTESITKRTIGEEHVEIKIVGSTDVHKFEGCDIDGFHLGAEETSKGIYLISLYCGPVTEGDTSYLILRETGI